MYSDCDNYADTPGPNTTGLLETLFIYIFSRLAQASVQALYNLSSSPVVLGPGLGVTNCPLSIITLILTKLSLHLKSTSKTSQAFAFHN